MISNIKHQIKKGAARVILCSALAISIIPMTASASSGDSGRLLEAQFEDAEGFRLFKYRTLKALNTLRDLGMTPQAIVETLSGFEDSDLGTQAQDAAGQISAYTDNIGQDIADAVTEQTQAIVQDAADAATAAARRQMNNWIDSLGESIGRAIRDAIDGVLGGSAE